MNRAITTTLHHYIGGKKVPGESGRAGDIYNPAIGQVTKQVPLASKADMQAANVMLVDADARVRKLMQQGMTEEEIVAENPLADYHDTWNWGFITTERMTQTMYRSLTE